MRPLVTVALVFALTLVGTVALFAGMNPSSPDYDAWKKSQVYTPVLDAKPSQAPSPFQNASHENRDACEYLIPLDGTFTLAMSPNDDWSTGVIDLPFTFSLYGADYTQCWINNNGNISFDGPYGTYSASGFPYNGFPMVAPFWADVDTRTAGSVWFKIEANYMVVIWDHVGYYNMAADKLNSFQAIISDGTFATIGLGNNVAFSYLNMEWTTGDASGGLGGFGGTPANVGINKGDGISYAQIGRFDQIGTAYDGPFDNNDGVDWLDCQLFLFNTGGFAANVAPVFVVSPPSPVNVHVGETWIFQVQIISPEPGQITTAFVTHDFPMGYVINAGNTCIINFSVTPTLADVGEHLVTITATDDGTPNLSSSYEFMFNVLPDDIIVNDGVTPPPPTVDIIDGGAVPPELLGMDPGYDAIIYTVQASGVWNIVVTKPAGWNVDWYCWLRVNGVLISGPNPIPSTTPSYTFVGVDFGAKAPVIVVINDNATLPVVLSSFTATLTAQNNVKLTWVTQSETGMLGYRVYRNESNSQSDALMITPIMVGATNTSTTQTYSITDNEVEIGNTYWYWLESVEYNTSEFHGPVSVIVEGNTPPVVPEQTVLRNAYPNPFKAVGGTTIEVDVKDNDAGRVAIYNLAGQEVISFTVTPGMNRINWNGKDARGNVCGSGIYFYRLSTPSLNQTRKLVIVK